MKRLLALALLCFTIEVRATELVVRKAALSTVDVRATAVGRDVLRNGGNAIDAAVAVSFALAVVHPQAGNLGGGGFLLYYDRKSRAVWALDFRETAPRQATAKMFLNPDGSVKQDASLTGALAVAVPGTVAGLAAAHQRFGSQEWSSLLAPSIELAKGGITTDERLTSALLEAQEKRKIDQYPETAQLFFPEGKPLPAGSTLVQSALAATLDRIARGGGKEFYDGSTAKKLVQSLKAKGGILSLRDLREYKAIWRSPVAIEFGEYLIYTPPPPSGGAIVLGEALGLLKSFDLVAAGYQTPASLHLLSEATRRAYLDRNRYTGDPDVAAVPFAELFAETRLSAMAKTIDPTRASTTRALTAEASGSREREETTHFSIVDSEGNIVSLTTTLNGWFGNGVVSEGGFFLNNTMDDFAIKPSTPNLFGLIQSEANAIRPGRRPASSMTPSIVMKHERPFLVFGTPGGATIPTTLLQVFLGITVWGKTLSQAVEAPRYHQQDLPEELFVETARVDRSLLPRLNELGHGYKEREDIGDVHAVMIEENRLTAVADPRRKGAPGGF